jgi:hypothetical protein
MKSLIEQFDKLHKTKNKVKVTRKGRVHYRNLNRVPKNGKGLSTLDIICESYFLKSPLLDMITRRR